MYFMYLFINGAVVIGCRNVISVKEVFPVLKQLHKYVTRLLLFQLFPICIQAAAQEKGHLILKIA